MLLESLLSGKGWAPYIDLLAVEVMLADKALEGRRNQPHSF